MECDGQNLLSFWTSDGYNLYFSFWAMFCTFTSPNDPKKPNSKFKIQKKKKKKKKNKKKKKKPEKNPSVDIIILHMCTINGKHMYGSGDVRLLV